MRTIKFRGKRVDNQEWVYGNLLLRHDSLGPLSLIEVQDIETFEINTYQVYPESVGQFTGLKDKNGVEIYEGDVVNKGKGEIFWHDRFCQFRVRWHNDVFKRVRGGNPMRQDGEMLFQNSEIVWSVIGNIHDNPELVNPAAKEQL